MIPKCDTHDLVDSEMFIIIQLATHSTLVSDPNYLWFNNSFVLPPIKDSGRRIGRNLSLHTHCRITEFTAYNRPMLCCLRLGFTNGPCKGQLVSSSRAWTI